VTLTDLFASLCVPRGSIGQSTVVLGGRQIKRRRCVSSRLAGSRTQNRWFLVHPDYLHRVFQGQPVESRIRREIETCRADSKRFPELYGDVPSARYWSPSTPSRQLRQQRCVRGRATYRHQRRLLARALSPALRVGRPHDSLTLTTKSVGVTISLNNQKICFQYKAQLPTGNMQWNRFPHMPDPHITGLSNVMVFFGPRAIATCST
jgi:hypothetical protein